MTLYLNGFTGEGNIMIGATKEIIQSGEDVDLIAYVRDANGNPVEGATVTFNEIVTPTLTITAAKPIIQTGEKTDLIVKVKDEDGSLVKGVTVEFFKEV